MKQVVHKRGDHMEPAYFEGGGAKPSMTREAYDCDAFLLEAPAYSAPDSVPVDPE